MTRPPSCIMCAPDREILAENELAVAFPDAYPVSPGHTLITPRRHIASWFNLTPTERGAVDELVVDVSQVLIAMGYDIDGFNIGVNVGAVAGQTIFHTHIHLIPRYDGDHADPRGGVRHLLPGRGYYATTA